MVSARTTILKVLLPRQKYPTDDRVNDHGESTRNIGSLSEKTKRCLQRSGANVLPLVTSDELAGISGSARNESFSPTEMPI